MPPEPSERFFHAAHYNINTYPNMLLTLDGELAMFAACSWAGPDGWVDYFPHHSLEENTPHLCRCKHGACRRRRHGAVQVILNAHPRVQL